MYPAHFNLHSAHLSLHRALYNTLNVIWTLISQVLGHFPKFRPKNSKLSMLTENLKELGDADSKSGHSFLKFGPRNPFLGKFGQKSQCYQFCLKIGTQSLSRMLILILSLVFWTSYPKFILGQIWAEKVKVVCFAWKLAYGISRGCWFLLRH